MLLCAISLAPANDFTVSAFHVPVIEIVLTDEDYEFNHKHSLVLVIIPAFCQIKSRRRAMRPFLGILLKRYRTFQKNRRKIKWLDEGEYALDVTPDDDVLNLYLDCLYYGALL